ncbi:hypothetical protein COV24_00870 [candidate division WWE3 bacterium CG10_big_fil_rev_8_21_14_0_10_32_10]|uniref:Hydrolase TatD n=1 Tax=candidate division WWE3 bacterium CG10_big_fil_rev_8_21_14_0_10_32_10 TaxID=1975090 RepID=A0A2H0RBM9_UNCKA|nr:MAG: hypothetical protein COV24_00870 [candidate division WWE3 bacterium CG10_big_fil_rev_8_21_14_0_10_32_10]
MFIMNNYIDTHFHLFLEHSQFNIDPNNIVVESISQGVTQMWLASTNRLDIEKNITFAKKYPETLKVWVGWHPEEFDTYDGKYLETTISVYDNKPSIVGIGEVGIDLADFIVEKSKLSKATLLQKQQDIFKNQLNIAQKHSLPVCIHSREAFNETVEVLESFSNMNFIWHCFNLKAPQTKSLLDKFNNIYFGFNNIITYKSGEYIKTSILEMPSDKILTETDAPFLAPRPFKYGYNSPEGVIRVYDKIAEILEISVNDLKKIVIKNVNSLMDIG